MDTSRTWQEVCVYTCNSLLKPQVSNRDNSSMIFAAVLEPDAVLNPKKKVFEEIQVEIYSCILCTYLLEGGGGGSILYVQSTKDNLSILQADLTVNGECVAEYKGEPLRTAAGVIRVLTLTSAGIR